MKKKALTFIDLFAGAGGLSEGFVQAGFKPVAHVEMNESACQTLVTRLGYYYLKKAKRLNVYYDYLAGRIERDDGEYYAELLSCREFDNKVPIYLSNHKYVEQLGYETVRKSINPPWQSSIRPISTEAYNYLLKHGFNKEEDKRENKSDLSFEEIKQLLKEPIRRLYRDDSIEAAVEARDYLDQLISMVSIQTKESSDCTFREFSAYCKTTKILYSYKLVTILACIEKANKNGETAIEDMVLFTREYYQNRKRLRRVVEKKDSIYLKDNISDSQIKQHLISNPIKALAKTVYFSYDSHKDLFSIDKSLWMVMGNKEKTEITQICIKRLKDYFESL